MDFAPEDTDSALAAAGVQRVRVSGHKHEVLCVCSGAQQPHQPYAQILSGSADGTVRVWDLGRDDVKRARASRCLLVPEKCAVQAVAVSPTGRPHEVFAAAGTMLYSFDLRADGVLLREPFWSRGVPGTTSNNVLSALAKETDAHVNEINSIDVSVNGQHAAVCDDAGNVRIVDLDDSRRAFRVMPRLHQNIATSVAFRPHEPWQLISAGLDAYAALWDFRRARVLHTWNLNVLGGTDDGSSEPNAQMVNPPWVHSVAESPSGCVLAFGTQPGRIFIQDVPPRGPTSLPSGSKGKKQDHAELKPSCAGESSVVGTWLSGPHSGPVAALAFWDDTLLVSGSAGRDKCFALWRVRPAMREAPPIAVVKNHAKINALCVVDDTQGTAPLICVADQTPELSLYRFLL
ncbi:WD repeat-containing protein 53-like [Porphyridium purpureum]|uniref:WD repeat-containing protein 53-like n=1 Tax=Porphyridium purpureum TaxID=35688 RepID=A0A5J4YV29_PORPP|nr:WD repeat-containing protein 53-like [Porphyridium purpureum]|eukprot:POR2993..scf227_4